MYIYIYINICLCIYICIHICSTQQHTLNVGPLHLVSGIVTPNGTILAARPHARLPNRARCTDREILVGGCWIVKQTLEKKPLKETCTREKRPQT